MYNSDFTTQLIIITIGIRLVIPEGQTDINDAKALSYKNNVIDIYSNSWGPPDGGYFVDGPGPLAKLALETSSKTVRDVD